MKHLCIVGVFPNDFRLLTSYHVFQNAESAVSTLYDLMICMIFLNTSSESVFFNELPDHLVKLIKCRSFSDNDEKESRSLDLH